MWFRSWCLYENWFPQTWRPRHRIRQQSIKRTSYLTVEAFRWHFFFDLWSHQICIFLVWEQHTIAGHLRHKGELPLHRDTNQPWRDSQMSRGGQIVGVLVKLCQSWTFWGIQDIDRTRWQYGFFGDFARWRFGWTFFHSQHIHKASLWCELSCVCSGCWHGKNLFHKFHKKIS